MKTILFGQKTDWAALIRNAVDTRSFSAVFGDIKNASFATAEFDAIVPLTLDELASLRARSAEGRANVLVPDERAVNISDDKLQFNGLLQSNGFGRFVPTVYDSVVQYPFIYKKRQDFWGEHSQVIFSPGEMARFEASIDQGSYFKQRYVPGRTEFTTHILTLGGEPKFATTFMFAFDRDHFVKGKQQEWISMEKTGTRYLDLFSQILRWLDFSGTCCFNYKVERGNPMIFEMNPRFGGSLCFDINSYLWAYLELLDEINITGRS